MLIKPISTSFKSYENIFKTMLSNVRIWLGQIISLLSCVLTLPFLYLLLTTEIAKQVVVYFVGQLGPELTKLLLEKDRNKFWLVFAKVINHFNYYLTNFLVRDLPF